MYWKDPVIIKRESYSDSWMKVSFEHEELYLDISDP